MKKISCIVSILLMPLLATATAWPAGKVYLVVGSDTGIWEGLEVGYFHNYYKLGLYTDPHRNAHKVMDPAFRQQLVDSYGTPVKFTWWMMGGNMYRYATNTNVPLNNIVPLYLMQKYHGEAIRRFGDEITLHYHNWVWSDYNGDGVYWWNQAKSFGEFKEDFDLTLAHFLLEENVFPVSFRAGWHFMNNDWQHYLDTLLPYSLHNDWPNVRVDTTEPLDNIYDWSQAPREFVPYRPSRQNYQIPGEGPGWNVRSVYTGRVDQALMDWIFAQANQGIDQVACIWSHLPEANFLSDMQQINDLAHAAAAKYPEVKFYYCTAVEAMQRYRKTTDSLPPVLHLDDETNSDMVSFVIKTDEPIFQPQPFVAIKNIYEQYLIAPCVPAGTHAWRTADSFRRDRLAKVGVAVCDTLGNLSTTFLSYLPDDIYIDNQDDGYTELVGNWSTVAENVWHLDSRLATVAPGDSARVRWHPDIPQSGYHNVFVQVPPVPNPVGQTRFRIYSNGQIVASAFFSQPLAAAQWLYIGTASLPAHGDNRLEMTGYGSVQSGKTMAADVAKFSALVRDRELAIDTGFLNFGAVSQDDTLSTRIQMTNRGIEALTVFSASSVKGTVRSPADFPIVIPAMGTAVLPIQFSSREKGVVTDTLFIASDDPVHGQLSVPVVARVERYFVIVDNDDSLAYVEEGVWYYSVAQAYGRTSRYAYLSEGGGASARFTTRLKRSGLYEVLEIVPKTVNSADKAVYFVSIAGVRIDSVVINQNVGSGDWVSIGRYHLPAGVPVEVKVADTGISTSGPVLRADAIKFALIQEATHVEPNLAQIPSSFHLRQNYPNPFNPQTTIEFYLPQRERVTLSIYDLTGRLVQRWQVDFPQPGWHRLHWHGRDEHGREAASGVYIYRLEAGNSMASRKMLKVR